MDEPLPFDSLEETPSKEVVLAPKVTPKKKVVVLTDEQKTFVASHWANPEWDLRRITCSIFDDANLDIHHPEGKAVRSYIATLGTTPPIEKPIPTPPRKGRFELTEVQKTNVEAFLNQDEVPTLREIFQIIFPNIKNYSTLCAEYQALSRFIKETNEEAINIWEEPVSERRYKPPGTWLILLGIVNKMVGNPNDPNRVLYDQLKMKASEERHIKALFGYMRTLTFTLKASQYDKKADRDLFISTFITHTQDKASELTPEEVDTYIAIAAETIQVAQIDREVQMQQRLITESLEGSDDENGTKAKLSMSLVESINSLRDKLKESKNHVHKLITSVAGSRSKRIENKINKNDYLGNWINQWIEEESRKELIALGKKEHEEDAAEFGRIKSMDDSWALIAGMTEKEARGG